MVQVFLVLEMLDSITVPKSQSKKRGGDSNTFSGARKEPTSRYKHIHGPCDSSGKGIRQSDENKDVAIYNVCLGTNKAKNPNPLWKTETYRQGRQHFLWIERDIYALGYGIYDTERDI